MMTDFDQNKSVSYHLILNHAEFIFENLNEDEIDHILVSIYKLESSQIKALCYYSNYFFSPNMSNKARIEIISSLSALDSQKIIAIGQNHKNLLGDMIVFCKVEAIKNISSLDSEDIITFSSKMKKIIDLFFPETPKDYEKLFLVDFLSKLDFEKIDETIFLIESEFHRLHREDMLGNRAVIVERISQLDRKKLSKHLDFLYKNICNLPLDKINGDVTGFILNTLLRCPQNHIQSILKFLEVPSVKKEDWNIKFEIVLFLSKIPRKNIDILTQNFSVFFDEGHSIGIFFKYTGHMKTGLRNICPKTLLEIIKNKKMILGESKTFGDKFEVISALSSKTPEEIKLFSKCLEMHSKHLDTIYFKASSIVSLSKKPISLIPKTLELISSSKKMNPKKFHPLVEPRFLEELLEMSIEQLSEIERNFDSLFVSYNKNSYCCWLLRLLREKDPLEIGRIANAIPILFGNKTYIIGRFLYRLLIFSEFFSWIRLVEIVEVLNKKSISEIDEIANKASLMNIKELEVYGNDLRWSLKRIT